MKTEVVSPESPQEINTSEINLDKFELTLRNADEVFLTSDRICEFTTLVIQKFYDTFRLPASA